MLVSARQRLVKPPGKHMIHALTLLRPARLARACQNHASSIHSALA